MGEIIEQRSQEWLDIRKGRFTASSVHKLMGARGFGKTGETYILEKVAESLGAEINNPITFAMQWGIDCEPIAKEHYAKALGVNLKDEGFIVAPWNKDAGCSPDALYEDEKIGVEIKCPYDPVKHVKYMLFKTQEDLKAEAPEYYWQVMMCLAVTGYKKWHFVSYHDHFNGSMKMSILEVFRHEDDIKLLKERIGDAVQIRNNYIDELSESETN